MRRANRFFALLALSINVACSSGKTQGDGVGITGREAGASSTGVGDANDGATGTGVSGAASSMSSTASTASTRGTNGASSSVVGDSTGTTAIAAAAFLRSIGVCTHLGQGVDAPTPSATAMAYAGIQNLRDDGDPSAVPGWISMHQSANVRVCLLTNQDVASTLDMAEQLNAAGALLAVEGPNEPNNFPVTYNGQTSDFTTTFAPVAALQRDLYSAVKADPNLSGVPVFHSSEAGGAEPDNQGLQFLAIPTGAGALMPDATAYADFANTHNYVCGHSSQLVDNIAWNASDPTLNGDWDGPYVEYGHTWHEGFTGYSNPNLVTLPRVTTETGWVTQGTGAITEEQQARVFLNLYLSAFKEGATYTFIYMLRDDPVQGYWGLFDTSYEPKTSGTYIHNLTTILADTGTGATPGTLDYTIATEPVTVHDLLLQKSDGTFELAVWDENESGGTDVIMVDLHTARPAVKVYDPTIETAPTQTLSGVSSVTLTLSDHPLIVEL
jgi:hypothetical protein